MEVGATHGVAAAGNLRWRCRLSCGMDGQADAHCWDLLWLPINLGKHLPFAHRQTLIRQRAQTHWVVFPCSAPRWPSGFWQDDAYPSSWPHKLSANIQLLFICSTLLKWVTVSLCSRKQGTFARLLLALGIGRVSSPLLSLSSCFNLKWIPPWMMKQDVLYYFICFDTWVKVVSGKCLKKY